ncbi:MAG: DHH family phosphoesterase [Planctomycetaceae bacterium]|nr:DHH family phosphoesterase [Planctomycetaceae bacterium]
MKITDSKSTQNRAVRLLETLEPYDDLIVMMHDNPDPDAIATGWAIQTIIGECLNRQARLLGGGAIVRAENRQLVTQLQPPIELVSQLDITRPSGVIFVDCGPQAVNHIPFGGILEPLAVVDHHPGSLNPESVIPFQDVRPHAAASASIATSYLWNLHQEPHERLATALLYAIRTETKGFETEHSKLDRRAIRWLSKWANPTWIAEIESAPLSRSYFGDLTLALQNTFLYGDAAFCLLPRSEGAEVVGEVADLLVRCEGVRRVMCAAAVNDAVLVSVRTAENAEDAGELVHTLLAGLGHGGGHAHRAGGKIPEVTAGRIIDSLEKELRSRWLQVCKCDRERGVRLVARREILENL